MGTLIRRVELSRWKSSSPFIPGDTRANVEPHDPDQWAAGCCACRFCVAARHGEALDRQTMATAPRTHVGSLRETMRGLQVLEDRTTDPVTPARAVTELAQEPARACAVCGATLKSSRATAKTCSPRCRQALSRENRDSRRLVGTNVQNNGRNNSP